MQEAKLMTVSMSEEKYANIKTFSIFNVSSSASVSIDSNTYDTIHSPIICNKLYHDAYTSFINIADSSKLTIKGI